MEADLLRVRFEKMVFFDNTSLLDDITYVDRMVSEFQSSLIVTQPDPLLPQLNLVNDISDFEFQVDVLMIADYSMFRKFSEIYKNNSETAYIALREYLEAIFEQVSTIYERLRFYENKQIHLRLIDSMPIIRPEDCPLRFVPQQFNETLDTEETLTSNITEISQDGGIEALTALHAIHDWLEKNMDLLPKHDHSLVITRRDLLSPRNESSTQGMAYVKAMCRGPDSASIIEDVGSLTTATIASHEMAHSLGAFHDGSGNSSECPGKLNYLMSPSMSGNENSERFGNSFLLSQCSIEQIEDFLNSTNAQCLRKPKQMVKLNTTKSLIEELKLGERFDQTQQCKIAFGAEYGVCTSKDFSSRWSGDSCRRLWCKNRQVHRFNSCETKGYLPMMDGTTCGTNKWCISGACVNKGQNSSNEDCKDVRMEYCKKFIMEPKRRSCLSKHIQQICCRTCKNYHPSATNQSIVKKHRIKTDL